MRVVASKLGKVYLVGAGPGDPELLTIKGARCLADADVVIYDRLIDLRLLDRAPHSAERIAVGKKGGHYSFPQEKINQLLAARAREGRQVVRLKGGDPFLFGRGGEEAAYLLKEEIPFEVIPGVSSALAVPASVGIPVTHRDLSSSITVVTGHQAKNSGKPVRWDLLARATDTLVVLMPLANLRHIVSQLVLHGRSINTPAAIIESGTYKNQRQVIATLGTIAARCAEAAIQSPALLIIGEVVQLANANEGSDLEFFLFAGQKEKLKI
ncbi:MAG: uroporphyrinogen-III C-methyltransferase [Acidobacteriota bacterium]